MFLNKTIVSKNNTMGYLKSIKNILLKEDKYFSISTCQIYI